MFQGSKAPVEVVKAAAPLRSKPFTVVKVPNM